MHASYLACCPTHEGQKPEVILKSSVSQKHHKILAISEVRFCHTALWKILTIILYFSSKAIKSHTTFHWHSCNRIFLNCHIWLIFDLNDRVTGLLLLYETCIFKKNKCIKYSKYFRLERNAAQTTKRRIKTTKPEISRLNYNTIRSCPMWI